MQKLMIMGLGEVGSSLLRLIMENEMFSVENILILDKNRETFEKHLKYQGKEENCIARDVQENNYTDIFQYIHDGDYCIDLLSGVDNTMLAKECCKHNIHYISTCDDCFNGEFNCFTFSTHLQRYKALKEKSGGRATSVVEFGMNPGMISLMFKRAVKDIVNELRERDMERAMPLLEQGKYAKLAQMLGIYRIVELDNDVSSTKMGMQPDTVYSTWNPEEFALEMNEIGILNIGFTTPIMMELANLNVSQNDIRFYDDSTGMLVVKQKGKNITPTRGIKFPPERPGDPFFGHLVSHEEIFSLADFLTIKGEDGSRIYAPTIFFMYSPCNLADLSLQFSQDSPSCNGQIIRKQDLTAGGETVGLLLQGSGFPDRYIWNTLTIDDTVDETPTILQVSASVFAALKYIMHHPDKGVLLPEDLPADEVIEYALPYLKQIESYCGQPQVFRHM